MMKVKMIRFRSIAVEKKTIIVGSQCRSYENIFNTRDLLLNPPIIIPNPLMIPIKKAIINFTSPTIDLSLETTNRAKGIINSV